MERPGSGSAKRNNLMRASRDFASTDTSGTSVTPYPFATICITVVSDVAPKPAGLVAPLGGAKGQGLIAQAMAFFQQNKPALIDIGEFDAAFRRQWIGRRHRQQKRVGEKRHGFDIDAFHRQRQHDRVEFAAHQFIEQQFGLGLAHLQPQLRITLLQDRQHARQNIGRQCRDDAELELA